jgi:hypothetical protein
MTLIEKGYSIRFAESKDSDAFVRWAMENPAIDPRDILDSLKENNPTCVVIVVERDGIPLLFAPFYATMTLAYLGFNPDRNDVRERLESLENLLVAMTAFAKLHGVREINTMTSADQMVAKWAGKHGFEPEARQLYRYKIQE